MAISSVLGSSALLPAGLGFRNALINGDFKVWQRGTSLASGGATTYTADRWIVTSPNSGRTASRQAAGLDGFQYCMRVSRDSGNTTLGAIDLSQSVETANSYQFAGKQITLSFWARAGANYSAASSGLSINLQSGTGTDQNIESSWTGGVSLVGTTITLTTSWQKFQFTSPVASSATGIGLYIRSTPVGTAGAADYFEITGVQLEQNYQPTPFEQRPYGVELALCQRYYFRQTAEVTGLAQRIGGYGCVTGGNTFIGSIRLPVTMRTRPTSSLEYSGLMCTDNVAFDSSGGTWQMLGAGYNTTNSVSIYATPLTGASTITFCQLGLTNSASSYVGISAEL